MAEEKTHSLLQSNFPVLLPYFPELCTSDSEFRTYIDSLNSKSSDDGKKSGQEVKESVSNAKVADNPTAPFIQALASSPANVHTLDTLAKDNKTLTENDDVALISSGSPLVDL